MIKENVNGCKMHLVDTDHPIVDSIMETGEWESKTTKFIKDNLKSGQVFIDIGASVGYYTLLSAKIVGSTGKVYAFEPLDVNLDLLLKNVVENGFKNIVWFPLALSDKEKIDCKFYGNLNVPGQFSLKGTDGYYKKISTIVFDELNKKEHIVPDMIKIDVEGSQLEVLMGMKEILSTDRELTIIVEDYTQDSVEWLINNYGFELVTTEREAGNYMLVKNRKTIVANPEPMTFHLLGTFNTPTNKKEGIGYAFSSKIMNIAEMLKYLGHKVIFYGAEGSEVMCDEFVQILSKEELPNEVWYNKYVEDFNHPANKLFNDRAIIEINKRKPRYFHSRDILLIPTGSYQHPIAKGVGLLCVEIGIGYKGVFADNKIFESYAWMHWIYGKGSQAEGRFYDMVIPPIFNPKDFKYSSKKDDYFLYIGRVMFNKGVTIAKEICEQMGVKLKVAGIDTGYVLGKSPNVEMVGFADAKKRKELLSKAKAVFVPTIYIEPFGYVVMEAAMSGTPVITTDWGAFTETVLDGFTGYRCRTFSDFMWAVKNIDKIKPSNCRSWAMKNFTMEKVAPLYQKYFEQIQNLFGKGWYSKLDTKEKIIRI
jgi:FkbM family methyltransferase